MKKRKISILILIILSVVVSVIVINNQDKTLIHQKHYNYLNLGAEHYEELVELEGINHKIIDIGTNSVVIVSYDERHKSNGYYVEKVVKSKGKHIIYIKDSEVTPNMDGYSFGGKYQTLFFDGKVKDVEVILLPRVS